MRLALLTLEAVAHAMRCTGALARIVSTIPSSLPSSGRGRRKTASGAAMRRKARSHAKRKAAR